jgi:hypothetical protein
MGQNPKFASYVKATAELQRVEMSGLTREDTIAFFINIYNALVIHANVVRGPPTNIWQRYKFFNYTSYTIGGYMYSLQDIENGVLRANRRGIGQFRRPFGQKDPRRKVALSRPEPRIHFALVCGAKSCPPIKTYSSQNLNAELQLATESFLDGEGCVIDMGKKEISLSTILKWYRVDFGANTEEVSIYMCTYLVPEQNNVNSRFGSVRVNSSHHECIVMNNSSIQKFGVIYGLNLVDLQAQLWNVCWFTPMLRLLFMYMIY